MSLMAKQKKTASVHEPRQARSLRTQERLLDAMESLLQKREPAEITVEDIVERAHTSVGAFYKRFGSKQDLLPLLLTRLQTNARRELEEELQKPHWNARGLTERVNALIDMFSALQIRRQRIIRACVAGRLTASLQMSEQDIADARATMEAMRLWLLACRDEIRHERPEDAVRIGLYLCLQSLQTALLFESLPADVTPQMITTEAKRMLGRYLSGEPV
jgi:AcrR family transcriptional regulator